MTEDMTVCENTSNDTPNMNQESGQSNTSDNNIVTNSGNWSTNTNKCINDNNDTNPSNATININVNHFEDQLTNPDDALQPIDRLEKYCMSDIIFHRQVVARSIIETLNDIDTNDITRVMGVISRLAVDTEPSIRAEMVEQLPQICIYLCSQSHNITNSVAINILPIMQRLLTDTNSHVRKMTQSAFVMLLEQNIIEICFIEEHICPLLVQLTDFSNMDDYRMEAVGMMGKMVRFLGKDSTEKLLLQTFTRLCLDASFHVRRICASNFGEICSIVGQIVTEEILLPRFRSLCQDSIWGVRKSCADFFVPVAITVSNKTRKDILSPLFVNLLNDQSRWVKTSAFQSLGPFISTFADPTKTGLYYSDNGIVVIEDHTSNDSGLGSNGSTANSPTDIDVEDVEETICDEMSNLLIPVDNKQSENPEFNDLFYWKTPISTFPELEVQSLDSIECRDELSTESSEQIGDSSTLSAQSVEKDVSKEIVKIGTNLSDDQKAIPNLFENKDQNKYMLYNSYDRSAWTEYNRPNYTSNDIMCVREPLLNYVMEGPTELMSFSFEDSMAMGSGYMFPYRRPPPSQDIIPNDLLEHYLSMTNPIHYQTVDPDLCHHCAYSLPAVALTLGRKNWLCLRETYELLAAEMQVKVRWTLASSLHQMSLILGSELTTRDLLPIFLSFMKDLDEVRFGILQNLAQFLKLLLRPQQQGILPKLADFLKMDNNRNWRFRCTLAVQIMDLTDIYSANEIKEYLLPIGLVLLNDKVSEVRIAAIRLVSVLMKQIFESSLYDSSIAGDNRLDIIWELNTQFADSTKWVQRQTYILVCQQLIQNESISVQLFIDKMLDHLLNLSADNVPNIRLVLARTIVNTLWPIAQLRSHLKVQQTLEELQSDKDKDVRQHSLVMSVQPDYDTINNDN
ncbi:serine/threonine-protein phosphatase 4 regulatory subunit 1-like [Oppia nitens]|uniref:serine/threonine-protein phosphatase 4 regulatory subunit 1-like n=1 Tax=Oppia nitens TaxID=1686743 RepID=UPI0023D9D1C2|nr:serine/threonine-protein phosphatase 4 regulatory subunit 1-like [Oppia nitens]